MRTLAVLGLAIVGLNTLNIAQALVYSGGSISADQVYNSLLMMMPASIMIAAVHFWHGKRASQRDGSHAK